MGQTTTWADWGPFLAPQHRGRRARTSSPRATLDWGFEHASYVPDRPASDDPGDWHPEDALLVPLHGQRRRAPRDRLRRRAGLRAPPRRRAARARRARVRPRGGGDRARPGDRGRAAPQHGGRAPPARLRPARRRPLARQRARRGLRRHPRRARLPAGHRVPPGGRGAHRSSRAPGSAGPRRTSPSCPVRAIATSARCSPPRGCRRAARCTSWRRRTRCCPTSCTTSTRASATVAARGRGTGTGSSCRSTTATTGSSASSGPTTRRTGCCRRPERLQALRAFANQAATAVESAGQLAGMRHLAEPDPLTGLRNRRGFARGHRRAHRPRHAPRSSLLICDLDNFKSVNDALGHEAGDEVLRHLRRRYCATSPRRQADVPTRLGGEEFALVLPRRRGAEALAVAERLRRAVHERVRRPCRPRSPCRSASPRPAPRLASAAR